jgi:hypothetical protein
MICLKSEKYEEHFIKIINLFPERIVSFTVEKCFFVCIKAKHHHIIQTNVLKKGDHMLETPEDLQLIKDNILLPLILSELEWNSKTIDQTSFKMKEFYLSFVESAMNRVTLDLTKTNKGMRDRGIKIYEQDRTEIEIRCRYVCRGYHDRFSMLWGFVKAEMEIKLSYYFVIEY